MRFLSRACMSTNHRLNQLRADKPAILPSLLLCDFGNLERECERLLQAGVRCFHLDVMDGRFVPNLTYGMPVVAGMRRLTDLCLDVHLMIEEPIRYVGAFADAGADLLTFHWEATDKPLETLEAIRKRGMGAGLAINPDTSLEEVADLVPKFDLLLVMSVPAGFGGQSFDTRALDKLAAARRQFDDSLLLEVDGGVNETTIGSAAAAGADLFVVGSAIFRAADYKKSVANLSAIVKHARSTSARESTIAVQRS